jgi:hypothetical protein
MKYRRLDDSGDMTFGHGVNNFLIDSPEAIAQSVKTRINLWLGEWFLNYSEGLNWQKSFYGKDTAKYSEMIIKNRMADTPGVLSIDSFNMDLDNRVLNISAEINTVFGKINFTSDL